LACLAATAAAAAPPSAEQALIDLENTLSAAYLKGDARTVATTLDASYTLTNSRAVVSHRDDDLREVGAGDPRYTVFSTHDMEARVFGDAGVVIGIVSLKGTAQGKPFDVDMRFTDTFVRRDGAWKMVAAQVTPIPK
jgi:ketosteroid isomerase-like protein